MIQCVPVDQETYHSHHSYQYVAMICVEVTARCLCSFSAILTLVSPARPTRRYAVQLVQWDVLYVSNVLRNGKTKV